MFILYAEWKPDEGMPKGRVSSVKVEKSDFVITGSNGYFCPDRHSPKDLLKSGLMPHPALCRSRVNIAFILYAKTSLDIPTVSDLDSNLDAYDQSIRYFVTNPPWPLDIYSP